MADSKRSDFVAIALAALAVGLAAGFTLARSLPVPYAASQVAVDAESANAASTKSALRSFRDGNTPQALETLEVALSLNVVVLDELLRNLNPPEPDIAIRVLQSIARYREEHSYSSSEPEADRKVAAVLSRYAPHNQAMKPDVE